MARTITLDVLHNGPDAQLCRTTDPPERLVLVWSGPPPPGVPPHENIASISFSGNLLGEPVYGEALPRGIRMEPDLPNALRPYVVDRLLSAIEVLRAAGTEHGSIDHGAVWLGAGGEVMLSGRGRARGPVDRVAALSLLPKEDDHALSTSHSERDIQAMVEQGDDLALGRFVQQRYDPITPIARIVITLHEGTDEVVPDIGVGDERGGLLDWGLSTSSGGWEATAEVTGVDSPAVRLAASLWGRLAAPEAHTPDPERFKDLDGVPSEALRDHLLKAPSDFLPSPAGGSTGAFLLAIEEPATQIREAGPTLIEPVPIEAIAHSSAPRRRWDLLAAITLGMGLMWLAMQWTG